MGLSISNSSILTRPSGKNKKQIRIMITGFNDAGKSTILYQLKLEKFVQTTATIGFNLESVEYKNVCFNIFDLNTEDKIREMCRHYLPNIRGLIFVIDSTDARCISAVERELHRFVLEDELLLRNAPLLVFANKQDLPNAMSTYELAEKLGLERIHDRQWRIQACSAKEGQGLYEGLHWLHEQFTE